MAEGGKQGPGRRWGKFDWRCTKTRREEFLRVLAETYQTGEALAAAGLTWPQACELRARHPDFAVRWEEVIAAGYDRLEAMLLRHAGLGSGAKLDPALGQALLKQRRAMKAEPRRPRRTAIGKSGRRHKQALIGKILDTVAPFEAGAGEGRKNGRGSGAAGAGGAAAIARQAGRGDAGEAGGRLGPQGA
ncbi:MAG TPA: hypothetical protein VGB54_03015 [Allosphingosinicella sp.]|jgi:hypothetical protein